MYYYILDPTGISPEHFERSQIQLQGLLAEFNVSGETARVTPLRSISDLVDTASSRSVKTLIACGSDDTFNHMLAQLKGRDFVLGFVPFSENSYLSKILGLENIRNSVKTIAARRVEKIDLGRIDNNFFLSYLELGLQLNDVKKAGFFGSFRLTSSPINKLKIRIDDSYIIEIPALAALVVNTRSTSSKDARIANPTDGYLDLLIIEKLSNSEFLKHKASISEGLFENLPNTTSIRCKKIECLEPNSFPIKLAGKIVSKFPSLVEIYQERLRIIVGKSRTF